ncbi:hypothetical protein [Singulisphaera sp. PoT]|uniref:hypothetical protein n=1 Tax=Singulisphaera sp. PoT TaxID=3411797 RepID=UPI003BF48C47
MPGVTEIEVHDDALFSYDRASRGKGDRPSGITAGFNVSLFAVISVMGILDFAASNRAHGISILGLIVTSAIDAVRYLAVVLITAAFVASFWRRFVSTLYSVRPITFQEAMAIVLMAGLVLGR